MSNITYRGALVLRRRGFSMIEVMATVFLLAVAMSTMLQLLTLLARERRSAERREWAIHETGNVMDRLAAEPYDQLDSAQTRGLAQARTLIAGRVLPEGRLTIEVESEDKPVQRKRLTLVLRWRDQAGGWERPVRLTEWVVRGRYEP